MKTFVLSSLILLSLSAFAQQPATTQPQTEETSEDVKKPTDSTSTATQPSTTKEKSE